MPVPQLSATMSHPAFRHELRRLLGARSHHRADFVARLHPVEGHRADDRWRAGGLCRGDRDSELLERGLGLDDDRVDTARDQRLRLLGERLFDERLGYLAVRLHEPAERTDVAENVSFAPIKSPARDLGRRPIDIADPALLVMPFEHDAGCAKAVGDQAIGAGPDVGLLDRENLVRRVEVPGFAAAAGRKSRLLELGSHRAVSEKNAVFQSVEKLHAAFLRKLHRQSHSAQGEPPESFCAVNREKGALRIQHPRGKKLDSGRRERRVEPGLLFERESLVPGASRRAERKRQVLDDGGRETVEKVRFIDPVLGPKLRDFVFDFDARGDRGERLLADHGE